MAITKTNSDYRSWFIKLDGGTEEELIEYISELTSWKDSEVKVITVNALDRIASINGIPAFSSTNEQILAFNTLYSTIEYNSDNHRVYSLSYYADRDVVEVQYDAHPLDPLPRNSTHKSEEFTEFLDTIFEWWKSGTTEQLQANVYTQPTFD